MAADASLISSFGNLATSDQRDYRGQLRAQREEGEILTKGIAKATDTITKGIQDKRDTKAKELKNMQNAEEKAYKKQNEIKRLENQAFDQKFIKQIKATSSALNEEGAGLQEDVANTFKDAVKGIKKDHDSYISLTGEGGSVKNKEKQAKEFGNVAALEKEIVKARAIFGTDKTPSPGMSKEAKQTYLMCLNSNDYDNVNSSIVDGKLQFEITTPEQTIQNKMLTTAEVEAGVKAEYTTIPASTKTYSLDDLEENFIQEAFKTETLILASGKAMKNLGKGEPYGNVSSTMLQGEADKLAAEFEKDPNIIADIAVRRLPGRSTKKPENDSGIWQAGSWASDLQEHPSLNMAVYLTAGVDVPDLDGDDTVVSKAEAEAVMNGPNRNKVIETLVNPKAEGYNHALSSAELGMWFAKQHTQDYYEGQAAKNKEASDRIAGLKDITPVKINF